MSQVVNKEVDVKSIYTESSVSEIVQSYSQQKKTKLERIRKRQSKSPFRKYPTHLTDQTSYMQNNSKDHISFRNQQTLAKNTTSLAKITKPKDYPKLNLGKLAAFNSEILSKMRGFSTKVLPTLSRENLSTEGYSARSVSKSQSNLYSPQHWAANCVDKGSFKCLPQGHLSMRDRVDNLLSKDFIEKTVPKENEVKPFSLRDKSTTTGKLLNLSSRQPISEMSDERLRHAFQPIPGMESSEEFVRRAYKDFSEHRGDSLENPLSRKIDLHKLSSVKHSTLKEVVMSFSKEYMNSLTTFDHDEIIKDISTNKTENENKHVSPSKVSLQKKDQPSKKSSTKMLPVYLQTNNNQSNTGSFSQRFDRKKVLEIFKEKTLKNEDQGSVIDPRSPRIHNFNSSSSQNNLSSLIPESTHNESLNTKRKLSRFKNHGLEVQVERINDLQPEVSKVQENETAVEHSSQDGQNLSIGSACQQKGSPKLGHNNAAKSDSPLRKPPSMKMSLKVDETEEERIARIKKRFQEIATTIKDWSMRVKKMNKTLADIVYFEIIPPRENHLPGTQDFFIKLSLRDEVGAMEYLKTNSQYIYQYDSMHRTALHRCSQRDDLEGIRFLLPFHPDLEWRDELGYTALDVAVGKKNWGIVKELLGRGAKPEVHPEIIMMAEKKGGWQNHPCRQIIESAANYWKRWNNAVYRQNLQKMNRKNKVYPWTGILNVI